MKISSLNTYSKPNFKIHNQSKKNQKITINKFDSIPFEKNTNNKIVPAAFVSLICALSLNACTAQRNTSSMNTDEEISQSNTKIAIENSRNEVINELFANTRITGNLNKRTYELEEADASGFFHRTRKYSGRCGDDKLNFEITQGILTEDKISGQINEESFEFKVKEMPFHKTITGTYKGQDISLDINYNVFDNNTITGNNTNLTLYYDFLSSDNFSAEGDFEYDRELLPIVFSYMKFENDILKEQNNNN